MIQDGEGRKMSKSLGNGVDPLDIIHSHGTDAMRFTLAAMATHTQDVRLPVKKDPSTGRNTSEKFDEGRKFCNKIWQVTEGFALPNLAQNAPVPVNQGEWSLADRWIVSRFSQTLKECDESIADYRFDQYAKLAYEFFWNDFCAWYIEIAKLALRDPTRAGQTANVLAAVLDGSLRLLHPVIPFITEALWWKLNDVRSERSLPGKIEGAIKQRLVVSAWPTPGPIDESAEKIFPLLRDVIVAIRNLRNEHKVETKKNVPVSIAASPESTQWIKENQQVIESLATCTVGSVGPDVKPPPNCGRAAAGGVEIFVEGLVDEAAELQRITKRIAEIERILPGMKARIANPSYREKAPTKLVQQTEDQIAAMEAELAKLNLDLKRFRR
jgi:valyl-tRNA synthetase